MTDNPEVREYHGNPQCSECGCLLGCDGPIFLEDEVLETWHCEKCGTKAVTFEGRDEIIVLKEGGEENKTAA